VSPALLTVLTFVAVAMAVVGVYSLLSDIFLRDRSRVSQRVDRELRERQRLRVRKSTVFKNLATAPALMPGAPLQRPGSAQKPGFFAATNLLVRFEAMIEQSGVLVTPQRLLALMAAAGLTLGLVSGLVHWNLLTGLAGAAVGAAVPFLYVAVKRRRRSNKLMDQLPEAFDLMGRIIRTGQTMAQSIQAVADEFDAPLAAEFAYCYEQQNLGMSVEASLRDLARRTGLLEIRIFVLALLVQQQAGGNLAELLDRLSTVIRERSKMRGKIRVLTAEGRFQALVLLGLPPAMLLVIMFFNPGYAQVLFKHPSLLIGTFVAEGLGYLWIRRIVNFDF
jgi:tight adherence protein B